MTVPMSIIGAARLTDRAQAAGDALAGARVLDERRRSAGHKHSASVKTIIARQLQALVRLRRNLGFRFYLCFIGARMALLPPALGLGTSRYCVSVRSEPWSDQ